MNTAVMILGNTQSQPSHGLIKTVMSHSQVGTSAAAPLASAGLGRSRLGFVELRPDSGLCVDLLCVSANSGASSYLGVLLPVMK